MCKTHLQEQNLWLVQLKTGLFLITLLLLHKQSFSTCRWTHQIFCRQHHEFPLPGVSLRLGVTCISQIGRTHVLVLTTGEDNSATDFDTLREVHCKPQNLPACRPHPVQLHQTCLCDCERCIHPQLISQRPNLRGHASTVQRLGHQFGCVWLRRALRGFGKFQRNEKTEVAASYALAER